MRCSVVLDTRSVEVENQTIELIRSHTMLYSRSKCPVPEDPEGPASELGILNEGNILSSREGNGNVTAEGLEGMVHGLQGALGIQGLGLSGPVHFHLNYCHVHLGYKKVKGDAGG